MISTQTGAKDAKSSLDAPLGGKLGAMSIPIHTLSSLLLMQDVEDHKPKLSKVSWLVDIMVFRSSIIPTIIKPVLAITFWSACVAAVSLWWGKEVGLRNDIVPLLSVVVGLLLVFRNSSAYERYSEGRKDFTSLISAARNLSRLIWILVCLPTGEGVTQTLSRAQLTQEKRKLIRLVVAFVVATKHHLRAEGGVHYDDLRGLLPAKIRMGNLRPQLSDLPPHPISASPTGMATPLPPENPSPVSFGRDEESTLGLPSNLSHRPSFGGTSRLSHDTASQFSQSWSPRKDKNDSRRNGLKRRPTTVRVVVPETDMNPESLSPASVPQCSFSQKQDGESKDNRDGKKGVSERTPLIKAGVRPDLRKTISDLDPRKNSVDRAQIGLGRMVELGLPLIIAHEISRTIFKFRKLGFLDNVGPAGVNSMQALVQGMTDQLGAMERVVQTPMPYVVAVHMKQATTLLLLLLPFVLVDTLKLKMIPLMFCVALIYMGIEGIAAQVEQPFGTDPCDLNLDLFCTELLCECEALLERLPEGDEDEEFSDLEQREADAVPPSQGPLLDQHLDNDDDGGD